MKELEFTFSNVEKIIYKLSPKTISQIYTGLSVQYVREEYKTSKKVARLTDSENSVIVYEKSFYLSKQNKPYCIVNFKERVVTVFRYRKEAKKLKSSYTTYKFIIPITDPRHSDYVFSPKTRLIKKS